MGEVSKMIKILMFILFLYIGTLVPIQSTYASKPNISIDDVKGKMPFEVLVPQVRDKEWKLIVNPYEKQNENDPKDLGIHYVKNENLMITSSSAEIGENLHFTEEKIVDINGNKGYFTKWGAPSKGQKGGLLVWIQGNTLCKMTSFTLDEDEMIKYAKSMRPID
ncbi:DUF4367 domain-containing protein [Paenibacillus sp. LMG 31457]|uniref:DUF4367 domain-containing protein n=2 Tax=Paenibacillus planticolens TaxID=2654976 RepID=A0ABX1ZUL1_9BACL|nr:DUF4367 domain-containing protein [Paenibacillus planticolens]